MAQEIVSGPRQYTDPQNKQDGAPFTRPTLTVDKDNAAYVKILDGAGNKLGDASVPIPTALPTTSKTLEDYMLDQNRLLARILFVLDPTVLSPGDNDPLALYFDPNYPLTK